MGTGLIVAGLKLALRLVQACAPTRSLTRLFRVVIFSSAPSRVRLSEASRLKTSLVDPVGIDPTNCRLKSSVSVKSNSQCSSSKLQSSFSQNAG